MKRHLIHYFPEECERTHKKGKSNQIIRKKV